MCVECCWKISTTAAAAGYTLALMSFSEEFTDELVSTLLLVVLPLMLAEFFIREAETGTILRQEASFDSRAPTFRNRSLTMLSAEIRDEADKSGIWLGDCLGVL